MKQIKIALLGLLLACLACHQGVAQSNTRYKNPIGRVYHNTVARYNGYYNANNKMKGANKDLSASLDDNYASILPLDKSELATQNALPDIDSIIIRLTVVNKLHSKSKWVDDNLLLIGKAYYMKKDYESAQQTFQYITGAYKPKKGEQKKKQTGGKKLDYDGVRVPWLKPKRSFAIHLKQEPVRDEATVWLVKSYIKMKKYDEAETVINLIEKNQDFAFKWRDDIEAIHAQMLIDQKRYTDAVKPLIYAIAMTDDKRVKTRYTYVLGQLYDRVGNEDKAIKAYGDVLDLKPDYKMAFNANIAMANAYAASGKSGGTDVVESLKKLARDAKYNEFRDQLYYTIAEIYAAQDNKETAEEYYRKAIAAGGTNKNQVGMAYMRLADMRFKDKAYPIAKTYYDSTLAFIDKDYPNLAELQRRSTMLTDLTQQLSIVSAQDSLQRLAGMSEKDRERAVSATLAAWQKQQQAQKDAANSATTPNNPVKNEPTLTAGAFYFYNTSLKAAGYTEFVSRYGNRKNEDNWRRGNKKSDVTALDNPDANGPGEEDKTDGAVNYESLLANIPTTPEKMELSNKKLAAAYYKLGTVYKEDFNNQNLALQTFETLETRVPGSAFEPQAWYQMYLIHTAQNDGAKADEYKNRLLTQYPNDPLSQYIRDPNYAASQNNQSKPAEQFYDHAYNLYDAGQYQQAIVAVDSAKKIYPNNPFAAKFDLLKAFAIGQSQPRDSFKTALTGFTKRYTTGPEQQRAKELLAMLNAPAANPQPQKEKKPDEMVSMGSYTFNPSNAQYVVILFDEISNNNKAISDSLVQINAKTHGSENLKVNTMLLDETHQMVMVKQFKNSTLAFNYFNELLEHENLFDAVETTYHMFVIDDKNFPAFFKSKNTEQYQAFFENHYK